MINNFFISHSLVSYLGLKQSVLQTTTGIHMINIFITNKQLHMVLKQVGVSKNQVLQILLGWAWASPTLAGIMWCKQKIKNSTIQVHDHSLPRWYTCSYVLLCKMDSERRRQGRLSPIEGNNTAREKHEERVARLTRQHYYMHRRRANEHQQQL